MRFHRLFTLILSMSLGVSACFHEPEEDNRSALELDLFHPQLASSGTYTELLQMPQREFESVDDVRDIVSQLIPRLVNHLSIFNTEVDLLPSSGIGSAYSQPLFKPGQKPRIQFANECVVVEGQSDEIEGASLDIQNLENLDSVFLDDKDDDGLVSEGDGWVHLYSQCEDQGNVSTTTGTIYFSNFAHQQQALVNSDEAMTDLGVFAHFETTYTRAFPLSIVFENFISKYNRLYTDLDVKSSFSVSPESRSMASLTMGETVEQYAFVYDEALIGYDDNATGEFETIHFKGKYYDSVLGNYVHVDDLKIKYDYAYENNLGEMLELSMSLNAASATVSFDSGTITISYNGSTIQTSVEELYGSLLTNIVPMD